MLQSGPMSLLLTHIRMAIGSHSAKLSALNVIASILIVSHTLIVPRNTSVNLNINSGRWTPVSIWPSNLRNQYTAAELNLFKMEGSNLGIQSRYGYVLWNVLITNFVTNSDTFILCYHSLSIDEW